MEGQDSLISNDGHSTSIVEALTTGPASDLAMEASYTPQLRYGYYSPYIASIMDIARILGLLPHRAVPVHAGAAAARMVSICTDAEHAALVSRPEVGAGHRAARDRAAAAAAAACGGSAGDLSARARPALVLPVEGAPLVFSTHYAHDVALSLTGSDGHTLELPASADARAGRLRGRYHRAAAP